MTSFATTLYIFITGLAVGSFLNVLIDRLPQEKSIVGRSHCDHCHKKLRWYDLIPVISYIMLRGRCRYCKMKLSVQYPLIEIVTGVSFAFVWSTSMIDVFGIVPRIFLLSITASLIVIFVADLKYQIIPDSIQVILFLSILLFFVFEGLTPLLFFNHVVSAIAVMLPIFLIFIITKGRGIGFGDVKLAFSIGFLMGWKGGLMALYIGFILGALVGIALLIGKRKGLKSKIAFGPFLVIGTAITFLWQDYFFGLLARYYGI